MSVIQQITVEIRKKLSNQFIRNLSWLGVAEIIYRAMRFAIVIIMAKYLTEYDYGLGAILMTVREFAITFSNFGIGAKIIQAEEKELKDLCHSAYCLNWVIFISLFLIQCSIAYPVALIKNTPEIILPICVSAIPYLVWPLASIQKTLIQKENNFKVIALTDSLQFSLASILSAAFAVNGMGVWSFALPAVIVAPLEIFVYHKYHRWRPSNKFTTKNWREIWDFGKNILGIGLLKTFRNNLDYIVIFSLLGVKELGTYFFGFNAGLGISLSIINAINSAILPHLCSVRTDEKEFENTYFKSLKIISLIIIPFVIFQSSVAQFYIPIIDQKWIPAIPIVVLICLSAIPRPFADAASQLLVAVGKPQLDLIWNAIFTTVFGIALVIGVKWNILGVAAAVFIAHLVCLPLFSLWTTRYVFGKKR
ncbi:lipopolysaccharide biosynthesis protein [Calothrix sp. UHCC 0171]|uniref:lipopolysaccharide biosynthesis protein n=1 Tax=Calothrix sp. UHCC 0171 TaxID=3110245 RepID=UPI002B204939|nr:lipopolysaccharide biosynthesis protein [Calothrix sp. UHCC 0171]MEA5570614.1 lipopolysaccharide biosynthesis protein [Calothrix sp. UHCC 0171]